MILTIENRPTSPHHRSIEGMFADRKTLFVDLFGWDVPVIDGRFEIDQFDDAYSVYLIAIDEHGEHQASMRLLPTQRPHMLSTLWPHLCPLGVPAGFGIWESTRLCLPQRHGAARRRELRNALITGMIDFALAREIIRYTGLLPEAFRKEVLAMGWLAEPLGPAVSFPGGPVGAFSVHIGPDTPERMRWSGVYVGPLEMAA
ncbi:MULTISPECIES: acyl-homoserine-lactone synthase [unclassified Sphingomonas]|uniref:acyl-homoserine-lactone synthase n=1 Tax=unclassified Sphingomonas TaxID=196159 RepID=UPI0006F6EDFB|nr:MULTISPECIES: acyl-homoserine-lactone synthase [unclassified Sphingomonas]KQX19143.1 autoinducer synthase [Sphingomonas sp. Root1294]KQY65344.1 autoinducer synthase [Sphingomonas sp. Root50]KRB95362.1 autoinducer synthase [Sphingomonas sp. Root720]